MQWRDLVRRLKGTNVGSTVAALDGMNVPVVLIAGGIGKEQVSRRSPNRLHDVRVP